MVEAGRYQLSGNAAHTYERDLVSIFNRPLAETTFDHVTLHEGERVLDTACGTGIVTRVALERFKGLKQIVGVDLNAGMLDVAREHAPATQTVVEWHDAYSGDCCHLIQCKAATQSGGRLPPVPVEGCHPFQTKAATPSERSDAWLDQVTRRRFPLSM